MLRSHIPVSTWLAEGEEVIATALDLITEADGKD